MKNEWSRQVWTTGAQKRHIKGQIQFYLLYGIFENVPSHEETCEKLDMFPEIVCVSLITQQILTAIISLFHFSHHHHPGGLLESLQWMCARLLNCSALNEIVISVVVISVGDMNHCPSVLTSSHPVPGCRQPSHANSLIHRVQFSPSNKAPGEQGFLLIFKWLQLSNL